MGEIPQVTSDKNEELNEKYFIILIIKTVITHSQFSVRIHPNMYITQTQEWQCSTTAEQYTKQGV